MRDYISGSPGARKTRIVAYDLFFKGCRQNHVNVLRDYILGSPGARKTKLVAYETSRCPYRAFGRL
jgi:hypothetical protein